MSFLHHLFPTTIYEADLNPPTHVKNEMVGYVDNFYRTLKDEGRTVDFLGDHTGKSNISSNREFFWLNEQIAFHVREYLKSISVDDTDISLFIQKSWPVVCPKEGGCVNSHFHKNSALSLVFYLQVDEDNDSGNLCFHSPSHYPQICIPVNQEKSVYLVEYKARENNMIIFPSLLGHSVNHYTGKIDRYSVSYDIMLVSNNQYFNENEVVNPNFWVKI